MRGRSRTEGPKHWMALAKTVWTGNVFRETHAFFPRAEALFPGLQDICCGQKISPPSPIARHAGPRVRKKATLFRSVSPILRKCSAKRRPTGFNRSLE